LTNHQNVIADFDLEIFLLLFEFVVTIKNKAIEIKIFIKIFHNEPPLEIPDDDRYQLVVDQQVNEQYLLLLLFVPLQHNKSPKNSTEKNRMINLIFLLEYFVWSLYFVHEQHREFPLQMTVHPA
jgi:hypothetical protein